MTLKMSEDIAERTAGAGEAAAERIASRLLKPRLPKDVKVLDTGNGIRITIIGRARSGGAGPPSGTVRYDVHYVADCDPSTAAGVKAALGRSTVVDSIPEPGIEDMAGETLVSDGKYRDGWFFVTGVNADLERSEPSQPQQVGAAILEKSVPANVDHLAASESGEVHDKTTFSAVAVSYRAPSPLGAFHGVQPVLENYPNRGDITSLDEQEYNGLSGGYASFKLVLNAARRPGLGTVTANNGNAVITFGGAENVLVQAAAGDELEILGVRGTIQSVDSKTQVTLTATWSGETVVALASYLFLGKIRLYARSVSAGGGYEQDLSKVPYVDVVLDAELSAPNAPTLSVEAAGGIIRASVMLPDGTSIDHAVLYRGTGSAVPFDSCTAIKTWPADQIGVGTTLQFEDTDFTTYEKENAQIFTYYAVAVNVRGAASPPSAAATATCRLNTGREGGDPVGKLGLKNLLYNSFIGGTAGVAVAANNTSQDDYFDVDATNFPGRPFGSLSGQAYGDGRFRGHTRWEANDGGTGAAGSVKFQLGTEVQMLPPGNTKAWYLYQEIEAWDTVALPRERFIKLKRNGVFVFSAFLRRDGAFAQPNGTISIYIDQYDGGIFRGQAQRRYRDSATDELAWYSGVAATVDVSGADLTTTWQRFYGVFQVDASLGNTSQLRVNIGWVNGTQGAVNITQVMLNEGEELGVYTADMGDTRLSWPVPTFPPGDLGDGPGTRKGKFIQP